MLEQLTNKVHSYNPSANSELIKKAYTFAEAAHLNQKRADGTPRLNHVVGTALLLTDLKVDSYTIAAALLHDVLEHTNLIKKDLSDEFGQTVADLVDGVTVVRRIKTKSGALKHTDNIRKLLLATAKDVRAVLIRLAEELHNLQNLKQLPEEEREDIIKKAFAIYAPLAARLGCYHLKWQIEDYAFKHQNHKMHSQIQEVLSQSREARENYIVGVVKIIKAELGKHAISASVFGRPKHFYSIYQKWQKNKEAGETIPEYLKRLHDQLAFMVLVQTEAECYTALGVIHGLWHHLPHEFNDYIANPKPNGYRSLQTAVFGPEGHLIEIQIKTYAMHEYNEFGPASHIFYKELGREKGSRNAAPVDRIRWLKDLVEWQKEIQKDEEFVEALKIDVFGDRVFVFTPRGDLQDLPKGATPVDFAYAVHTDLGHRCLGAKINDKMVPLTYRLQNGEVCEIFSAKKEKGPSQDWLIFVKTRLARHEIKKWLKKFR